MIKKEFSSSIENRNKPLLERYRAPVDEYIQSTLDRNPSLANAMILYHLGYRNSEGVLIKAKSDGKALRPTLALLSVDAFGGDWMTAVPAAAAIELLHNFTLIHDDIQDGDKSRHGKPTVWALWGFGQGINIGNVASYMSSLTLLELSERGFSSDKVVEASKLLFKTGVRIMDGQMQDLRFEQSDNVTVDEYMEMIRNKTGVLIETALLLGADLADIDPQRRAILEQFAQRIGRAFQISDDILGIWGDEKKTGKRVAGDIARRKRTLPVILAFTLASDLQRDELSAIYTQPKEELDDTDIQRVLSLLEVISVQNAVQNELTRLHDEAVELLHSLSLDWAQKDFAHVADLLSFREK